MGDLATTAFTSSPLASWHRFDDLEDPSVQRKPAASSAAQRISPKHATLGGPKQQVDVSTQTPPLYSLQGGFFFASDANVSSAVDQLPGFCNRTVSFHTVLGAVFPHGIRGCWKMIESPLGKPVTQSTHTT